MYKNDDKLAKYVGHSLSPFRIPETEKFVKKIGLFWFTALKAVEGPEHGASICSAFSAGLMA